MCVFPKVVLNFCPRLYCRITRPERVSSKQPLAWLNAIAENDSGDESKGENVCEGLYQG